MYRLNTDLRTGVIEVVVGGFWTDADVASYRVALARQVEAVRATGRPQLTLYDYTHAVIQSQETVAQLAQMARENPLKTRKTAIFTGGQLARRQACRIAEAGDHIQQFDDREAAIAWLRA